MTTKLIFSFCFAIIFCQIPLVAHTTFVAKRDFTVSGDSLSSGQSNIAYSPMTIIVDLTSTAALTSQDSIILNNPFLESNYIFSSFIVTDHSEGSYARMYGNLWLRLIKYPTREILQRLVDVEPMVNLWVLIGKQGRVIKILYESGGSEFLARKVAEIVMETQFSIALRNNQRVLRWMEIPFDLISLRNSKVINE